MARAGIVMMKYGMSCLMVNPDTVSHVSYFISRLLNRGFNSFGFEAEWCVYEAFGDCNVGGFCNADKVYEVLYILNHEAYVKRYELKQTWLDVKNHYPNPHEDIWKHRAKGDMVQDWHYQMLMHLQVLCYNMAEDSVSGKYKIDALRSLAGTLAMFIATHNETFRALEWR